jgi:transcriptional regulator with XRE-family HTH domain
MRTLTDRFNEALKKKGITKQREVVSILGVSKGYMSELLSGKKMPSDILLNLIEIKLGICSEWLLTGKGEMFCESGKVGGLEVDKEKDFVTWAIVTMLKDMPEEKKKDVLKYAEEKKQLADLLKGKKKKQAG